MKNYLYLSYHICSKYNHTFHKQFSILFFYFKMCKMSTLLVPSSSASSRIRHWGTLRRSDMVLRCWARLGAGSRIQWEEQSKEQSWYISTLPPSSGLGLLGGEQDPVGGTVKGTKLVHLHPPLILGHSASVRHDDRGGEGIGCGR